MRFSKFQGFGNDYIVFEARHVAGVGSLNELARAVCDRHYGAGADGMTVVSRAGEAGADFVVRIFNADGSEASLSGNGTRCAVAHLYHHGLWSKDVLRLRTRAGVMLYRLREEAEQEQRGIYWFDSSLGQPRFASEAIPMLTKEKRERVVAYPLEVEGETINVTALEMGNPNCCVFVDDFDALDWRSLGRALEVHTQFPERTNVEFVRVIDRERIEIRIWERGVGETFSSGTCSCAAMVAACINDLTERRVHVETQGGRIAVEWRDDNEVMLTGRADFVYRGEWPSDGDF